ncbi:TPA: Lrp/AsnC family transcriptional regulator [archaeon]|nr:Lrp/AsnC family transcriptional regulator [Candidatus Naiadarchaeales archaeon SRR2090153.bin461]
MTIDKKDRSILMALQEDAKQSSRDLSKKLDLPATTIHERIRKMEKDGIIKGYHVAIDYEKAEMPSTAIVLIKRTPIIKSGKKIIYRKIADLIAKLPEIQEVHTLSGEFDMMLKIRGRNERDIGNFVSDIIWSLPEVERTQTLLCFHTAKDTCKIELK